MTKDNVLDEDFTETYHKIISVHGMILSSLDVKSSMITIFIFWSDTPNL